MATENGSHIFIGCRSVGKVSDRVPLVARYIKRRRETLLVTSAGRCFHTYGADHFSLLAVSGRHEDNITALAGDAYHVYTACGNKAYAWRRGSELKHTYGPHDANVRLVMPFATLLLTVDENGTLTAWYVKEEERYAQIPFDETTFNTTCLAHPATYLNKILLGSEQGTLQLWNVNTCKLIHTFKGWGSAVTALEQAPAVDVFAIGLADGAIVLHNLKVDKTVTRFDGGGSATVCISFRTDGHPVMVTGCSRGHLAMWDLEKKSVAHQIRGAHTQGIAGLVCFPSEPVMATNSPDNSLKLWIFDMSDGGARLLRIREGHSAPPTFLRYVNDIILTAGEDSSMRILSSAAGHHADSLGRASYNREASKKKKRSRDNLLMPFVTQFSFAVQKDKQWDSVAAVHRGLRIVTTWSLYKKKMGLHKLAPDAVPRDVAASCLTVSHCGNFVFVGYGNGDVHKFNMQSGIHRGRWGGKDGAHSGPVRGVQTDNLNKRLITVGSDLRMKLWPFDGAKVPLKVLRLEEVPSFTRCHRESGLIAVCNEDFSMTILDLDTVNVVRKFQGHTTKINDACFSHDGRWLISASMDCTVRTWDIPTGQLIDIFKLNSPCTSIDISPSGDFLATAHVDQIGVSLWANRTLYVRTNLRPLNLDDYQIPTLELPATIEASQEQNLDGIEMDVNEEFISPEQISEDLITLSNLSTSRWQNLLELDTIKNRNKPKAPPKLPEAAPFFLPTIGSDLISELPSTEDVSEGRILRRSDFSDLTAFGRSLTEAKDDEAFDLCSQSLRTMGPSMIDFEIVSLGPDRGGSELAMAQFLKMTVRTFETNRDFELAQSRLALFLKRHGTAIADSEVLLAEMERVNDTMSSSWERLQESMFYNLCVVKSIKNM